MSSSERVLNITVLFTDGKKNSFQIEASKTVTDLISLIHQDQNIIIPQNTNTLILYHGKIISPNEILENMESMNNFTVHCFFKSIKLTESQDKACFDLDLRGFDRLQRLNYTQEQIEIIRSNFRMIRSIENEITEEQEIEIEEEWFPSLFNTELPLDSIFEETDDIDLPIAPTANPRLTCNKSFFLAALGFFFGYFLGIGSFIFAFLTMRNKKILIAMFFGSCIHYAHSVINN